MGKPISHLIGVDDAPFLADHRGDVIIVGAVFGDGRLEGVVHNRVRRDGVNSTGRIAEMVRGSRFASHLQLIMLQGIAFAGFNVVDIHELSRMVELPVLVVMRRYPDFAAIRRALIDKVPGGRRKWRLIEAAGKVESCANLFIQRAGIGLPEASEVIKRMALRGHVPEPLRIAHLIAGGMSPLGTRQRV